MKSEKVKISPNFVRGDFWWGKVDSNHRRQCQQIYSLSPLATREFPHIFGAGDRIRTNNLLITNQLHCHCATPAHITCNGQYYITKPCVCQEVFRNFLKNIFGARFCGKTAVFREKTASLPRISTVFRGRGIFYLLFFFFANCFSSSRKVSRSLNSR